MLRQREWLVAVIALGLGVAGAARAGDEEVSTVMGSITVGAGEHRGDLSAVNGSIHVGESAVVGRAHSVNGSVTLEAHATAAELATVNGSVKVTDGGQVSGRVRTVNGSLSVNKGADVAGAVSNVNGSIHVAAAHVGGDVSTVSGDIDIGPDARVDGGVIVHKDHSSGFGERSIPRVVIRPGSVVKGTLRFEREVRLYVSDRATIGPLEGASAIRFSGDRPPE